jgi:hypothetical protein
MIRPISAPPERLATAAFIALAAATLAFFVAAGIVLPVAPQFAKDGPGADETGVGIAIASFSIAALNCFAPYLAAQCESGPRPHQIRHQSLPSGIFRAITRRSAALQQVQARPVRD